MRLLTATLLALVLLCGCRAKHPLRINPKQLAKLTGSGQKFVIVFGSVRAIQNGVDVTHRPGGVGAQLRFSYDKGMAPLLDVPIPNGERFYVVLKPPAGKTYLDKMSAEVRWIDSEFDPLTYMRLNDKPPYAFYIGEIEMTVADQERVRVKQILSVKVFNELAAAKTEFSKIYPTFPGEMVLNSLLTARPGALPERRKP